MCVVYINTNTKKEINTDPQNHFNPLCNIHHRLDDRYTIQCLNNKMHRSALYSIILSGA